MGTLLAFPLPMPLGGCFVTDPRVRRIGARRWRVRWTPIPGLSWPSAFVIAVDGQHYTTVHNVTATTLRLEGVFETFTPSPIIEVIQLPSVMAPPDFFTPGYFATLVNNKIRITFDPPASVADVEFYRVYWDKGTGTVVFDDEHILEEVSEDGLSSYEVFTPALATGTFKFVIRAVDKARTESTTVTEFSQAIVTLPGTVTAFKLTYDTGTDKATLTWTDPSDIGSGTVKIFDNLGVIARPHPDYTTVVASVAAGVQTFTTAVLTEGWWVFGAQVNDATNQEPNTDVLADVRLDASLNPISNPPPKPFLEVHLGPSGKVFLTAYTIPTNARGITAKFQFFTNDGAGGAIDFSTPLEGVGNFTDGTEAGQYTGAVFLTAAFGETARKFSARAFTSGGVVSLNADERTITPDATAPPDPLNVATTPVRE